MPSEPYRHRMTVELTESQYNELQRILPHGMKKHLFQALVDGVIAAYNKGGAESISLIVGRHLDATQISKIKENYE